MSTSGERIRDEDSEQKPPARPRKEDCSSSNERTGDGTSGPDATTGKSSDTSPREADHGDNVCLETTASRPKSSSHRKPIITPTPDDILMGRGWPYQKNPGNKKMRSLVEEHKPIYNSRSRSGKGELVKELLRMLRKSGSRFLIRSEEGDRDWEIASKGEAYEKVCHALRGKPKQKAKKLHVTDPSTYQSMDAAGVQNPNRSIPMSKPHSSAVVTMSPSVSAALGINNTAGIRLPMPGTQQVNPSPFNHMLSLGELNPSLPSMSSFLSAGSQNATSAVPHATGNQRRNLIDHAPAGAVPGTATSTQETTEQSHTSPSSRANIESPGDDVTDLPDDLNDADTAVRIAISAYLRRKRGCLKGHLHS
jgi:hypothetical protein